MAVLLVVLALALVLGEVDARGSTRDTVLATFNAALITPYPEIEERSSMLIDQVCVARHSLMYSVHVVGPAVNCEVFVVVIPFPCVCDR